MGEEASAIETSNGSERWGFKPNNGLITASSITVRGILNLVMSKVNPDDQRPVVPLGHGDPSAFPCFRTTPAAEDAVVDSLRSAKFNCYSSTVGILPARRAIAEYLNKDLPNKLSEDDVFLTIGCTQAIEVALTVLARPGANILLPRPGFPYYEARAAVSKLEVRHFDLVPERGWEVDLEAVESLADENTVAMVIINPGNPCGCVYSYEHLKRVAETAKKLGILVISDEVYAHLTFGSNKFVPMGVFGSVVPVLTLGSISKRWIVPGWRLGWLVTADPNGILLKTGFVELIQASLNTSPDPPTFIQAVDLCYDRLQDVPCITCPKKPGGAMFAMVKLECSELEGIKDDMEFCLKLAKEESVIVLPGTTVGQKGWLRITFAIEPATLEVGVGRIKAFCERHVKKKHC
ncbi:S-alkyl-thiohydroximate lyase SUR1 [Linum perenne]